jgi:NADPH:quinone reductase-like Zn-dependent oxidoreductase
VRVIAATKTADEREYLLSLGAEKVIVTEEEDLLMRINKITDNRGVDVVFDGLAARRCRCSAMCWRRVAAWCCMACKAATRHHSRPVRRSRRTSSSLCTASATSPASRSWASPGSRRLAACPA